MKSNILSSLKVDSVFKITEGLDRVNRDKVLPLASGSVTKGHRFEIIDKRTKGLSEEICFSTQVC